MVRTDPSDSLSISENLFSTDGTVYVSYSYVNRASESEANPSVFHTRQISYPLLVTVYQMLECHSLDILPLPPTASSWSNESSSDDEKYMLSLDSDPGWCLASVSVRNTYGTPFAVSIERMQTGECNQDQQQFALKPSQMSGSPSQLSWSHLDLRQGVIQPTGRKI
jgi:trafficking protein particle complex subunit 9